jgi:hypothetical protein
VVTAPAEHRSPLTRPWRWAVAAAALVACLAAPQVAKADSLFDAGANCIHTAPASWVSPPSKSGDQFVVEAPAKYKQKAADAAHEIRNKDFFGYYEDKLNIARLGYPGQQGKFELFLDPALTSALPEADGANAPRCEDSARDAVIVDTGINSADGFHATIAHELFHAAQAQLGAISPTTGGMRRPRPGPRRGSATTIRIRSAPRSRTTRIFRSISSERRSTGPRLTSTAPGRSWRGSSAEGRSTGRRCVRASSSPRMPTRRRSSTTS